MIGRASSRLSLADCLIDLIGERRAKREGDGPERPGGDVGEAAPGVATVYSSPANDEEVGLVFNPWHGHAGCRFGPMQRGVPGLCGCT
jgi:hypothetical protein